MGAVTSVLLRKSNAAEGGTLPAELVELLGRGDWKSAFAESDDITLSSLLGARAALDGSR